MKNQNETMRVSLLALAVQGALVAMCSMPAYADDEELAALKMPANYIEIGASNTSRSSAKFGEYTGEDKSGADLVGNFSVRGGDAYGDANGTGRWAISGSNLGLTSRTLGATTGNQGQWNIGIGYDELRHNLTDSYQTPYQGSMGGNSFTLPAGFGVVVNGGPPITGTRVLNPTQLGAFRTVDVGTTRKNTSLTAGVNLAPQWNVTFDYNHLDQSGAKLMAFGAAGAGTGLVGTIPGVQGEAVAILPNPTNYKTDTVNLALNWAGDKGHMTASYFGSYFRDGYDRVTFDTFYGTNGGPASYNQTMSTPPSNDFHQLNLSGGYALGPKTKLTGGLSYGRNTQNDPFVYDSYMMLTTPKSSLEGLVVNTHADLKLIDQTAKDLTLSAGIKYDERDNRTASNLYNFNALSGNIIHYAHYPNTPLSNKKTQLELAGDYRVARNQNIRLAYNREEVKRWCNQYATGGTTLNVDAYVAGVNNYPAGTNCVVATASTDDKLGATYKTKASDVVSLNLGYDYSRRKTDSDPNAIAAFISLSGNPNVATGTIRGINAGDFLGFYPYFDASRKEQVAKAGVDWQANDKLSLGLRGRYTDDKYDSLYGVKNGNTWSLNLDATYNYSEDGTVSAYLTQQHRQRDLTNMQKSPTAAATGLVGTTTAIGVPLGATWTNKLKDDDTTVGLTFKRGGLMGNKLELDGDLTYSLGRTGYGTQLNYVGATGGFPLGTPPFLTCAAPQIFSCGDLPDIKNRLIQFKLTGNYKVNKSAKVAVGYTYQHLDSNDYSYNGLQYGYTPNTLLPSNEQAPSYSVNLVAVTFIHMF
jgi:MtrB/PioB family decaheme-associated outer membrane protein